MIDEASKQGPGQVSRKNADKASVEKEVFARKAIEIYVPSACRTKKGVSLRASAEKY
jgi:hypothetical protein